jgi:hypothetical protein
VPPFGPCRPPRRVRLPLGLALVLAGGASSAADTATLQGRVVDPQERFVVGAVVSLGCGAVTSERRTDAEGAFRFDRPGSFAGCTVTASAPGFDSSRAQPVGDSSNVLVRLPLPRLNETLTVRPHEGEAGLSAYRSLASVSITRPELRSVSDDTAELIRYARARAGLASPTENHVYVEGLPAGALPPADTIDRIVVDGDPFSAEYADGSEGHIDIVTSAPDRRFRLSLGGATLGMGGGNTLDSRAGSKSRSWNLGVTGPVPQLPLTFSLHSTFADDRQDVPVRARVPEGVEAPPLAAVSSSSGSVRLALSYSRGEATRASVAFFGAQGEQSNAGLSGTTLPEAAMDVRSDAREVRATFTTRSAGRVHRAGLVGSWSENALTARSQSPSVDVSGAWTGGGAEAAALDARGARWVLKYVVRAAPDRRHWSMGATVSRSADSESYVPNPAGRTVFETAQAYADAQVGLGTGTWFGARGGGRAACASTAVAPFVEADVLRSAHVRVRGGLRADYQSGGGTLLSPRVAGAATWRGSTLRWGGGVFVHDWATGVLLQALENDRSHLDRALVTGVSSPTPIDSRIAGDLTRPRDLVLRASLERPWGSLTPGVEYTWTHATHRPGSRRLADGEGWVDVLESDRFARKHQVHLRLQAEARGQRVSAHYQWTRSRDDGDGPFSFPEAQDDLGAEEARSAGVAPHELSVVASLRLPGEVSLTVVDSWHSATPYDVTTGTDPAGIGLYNFRGGRARNSGDGPGYHSVSLYGSRRIALPLPGGQKTYASIFLHVENLLDDRNYAVVGGVAGSPLFGVPLVALPGRALRLSVSFDH